LLSVSIDVMYLYYTLTFPNHWDRGERGERRGERISVGYGSRIMDCGSWIVNGG
jgi:hypothetical protein